MSIRLHNNFKVAMLNFFLTSLLSSALSGTLVLAQDLNVSHGPTVDESFFVLVETQSKFLNVRQDPSSSSPIIGKLLKGSKVPLVDKKGDGGTNGNWYRVEIQREKVGWVSKNYSRKIKTNNQIVNVRTLNPAGNNRPPDKTTNKKPWANIDGFRSAKFGMTMKAVKKAIREDFSILEGEIKIIKHPIERTESFAITVDRLLPESGGSRVVYVFGYQSKRLIQVNILAGHPVDTIATPQQVINSGNLLGDHFLKKRYQKEDMVAHVKISDGSILIFRGKDQEGRMVLLSISNSQTVNKTVNESAIKLNLSYIEKPGRPDIYQLQDGDF